MVRGRAYPHLSSSLGPLKEVRFLYRSFISGVEGRTAGGSDSSAMKALVEAASRGDMSGALMKLTDLEEKGEALFWSYNNAVKEAVTATTGANQLSMIGSYEGSNLYKFLWQLKKDLATKNTRPFEGGGTNILSAFDKIVSNYETRTIALRKMS